MSWGLGGGPLGGSTVRPSKVENHPRDGGKREILGENPREMRGTAESTPETDRERPSGVKETGENGGRGRPWSDRCAGLPWRLGASPVDSPPLNIVIVRSLAITIGLGFKGRPFIVDKSTWPRALTLRWLRLHSNNAGAGCSPWIFM